jgi:hypothetical protein
LLASEVDLQIENLLDEDHEAVDVEFDYFGQVELDGGAEQLEDAHQHRRGVVAEVLEQAGGQVEDGQDAAVAQIVEFDLLGNGASEYGVNGLEGLDRTK